MKDRFVPIKGYPHYWISEEGKIFSTYSNKILRPRALKHGYQIIDLCNRGDKEVRYVHQLVLETFVGPCPEGMECCHNDGNPKNNNGYNLRWDTHSSNMKDKKKHGTSVNPIWLHK